MASGAIGTGADPDEAAGSGSGATEPTGVFESTAVPGAESVVEASLCTEGWVACEVSLVADDVGGNVGADEADPSDLEATCNDPASRVSTIVATSTSRAPTVAATTISIRGDDRPGIP